LTTFISSLVKFHHARETFCDVLPLFGLFSTSRITIRWSRCHDYDYGSAYWWRRKYEYASTAHYCVI